MVGTTILLIIHNVFTNWEVGLHSCNVWLSIMLEPRDYIEDFRLYQVHVVRACSLTLIIVVAENVNLHHPFSSLPFLI